MPIRLDARAPDFAERFRAFLDTKREAAGDVDQVVRAILADVAGRLTRGYGAGGMRSPCAEVPGWRIVLCPSLRLCMGSRADFWRSSCQINSCLAP